MKFLIIIIVNITIPILNATTIHEFSDHDQFMTSKIVGGVRLRWKTDCFSIYKNEVKIKNSEIKELYLMIFIDENLNKTIEENEYNRVTIKFE